jgi:hypothetical protein
VFDPAAVGERPKYFMLLQWSAGKVATIRDFRHAACVIDGAEVVSDERTMRRRSRHPARANCRTSERAGSNR